jgi:hypothetical protein
MPIPKPKPVDLVQAIRAMDHCGGFCVSPNSETVMAGRSVTWRPVGLDVHVEFPGDCPFVVDDELSIHDGGSETLQIRPDASPGPYVYRIVCQQTQDIVVGDDDNDPTFIID